MWRVASLVQKDCSVWASRAAPMIHDLYDTLDIMSSIRTIRATRLSSIPIPRKSTASDEIIRDEVRTAFVDDEYARILAKHIRDSIHHLGHLYIAVSDYLAMNDLNPCSSEDNKKLLIHCASLFDVNECQLGWFPIEQDKKAYFKVLYKCERR